MALLLRLVKIFEETGRNIISVRLRRNLSIGKVAELVCIACSTLWWVEKEIPFVSFGTGFYRKCFFHGNLNKPQNPRGLNSM